MAKKSMSPNMAIDGRDMVSDILKVTTGVEILWKLRWQVVLVVEMLVKAQELSVASFWDEFRIGYETNSEKSEQLSLQVQMVLSWGPVYLGRGARRKLVVLRRQRNRLGANVAEIST